MRTKLIPIALGIGAIARAPLAADLAVDLKLSSTLSVAAGRKAPSAPPLLPAEAGLALRMAEALSVKALKLPPPDPALSALLAQARLWQSRNREDLVAEALNKLLAIAPEHPEALAQLGFMHMRAGKKEKARQVLERLRRAHPDHPDVVSLATLIRLDEDDKDRLRHARALARSGRAEEALAVLRLLYPAGPPTGDLALEYWRIVGDTQNGWERAHAGLQRLVAEYPDNLRYRLVLAEHIVSRRPDDSAALKTIKDLTRNIQFEKQARAAWRSAMLRLSSAPSSIPLIEEYLAREEVEDRAVKEHLAGIRQAIAQHQRLMADPYYRARLAGISLLDGGKLDEADDRLTYAAAGRPDDPEVLGALGLLRLRQGHHAEAQAYFMRAQERDRGSDRWQNLQRVARFWGLMREATDAADAGEHALAESKLAEARRVDPREHAAILGMARVRMAQGRLQEAEAYFREALAMEPSNTSAMQNLALIYLRAGRDTALDELLARMKPAQRKTVDEAIAAARAALFKEKAEAFLASGDSAQAIALLEQAAIHDHDDPWLRYDLARLYAARQEPGKGEVLFTGLLARRPGDAAVRYAYALYQSSRGQPVKALTTLEGIAAAERNTGMTTLQRRLWTEAVVQGTRSAYANGQVAAARSLLDKAEQALDGDDELKLDIADARIDIGDVARGHDLLVRLMGSPSPSVDWSLRHARLLASAGGDDMVAPLIDSIAARTKDARQADALADLKINLALRKAEEMRRQNRLHDALAVLTPVRGSYPDHQRLLAMEARVYRASGRLERAQETYGRLVELRPDDRDAAIAQIEVLIAMSRHDEARRLASVQLANLEGATPDQLADLAGILLDLADNDGAARLIATVLDAMPDNARLLGHASELAEREGRVDDAITLSQRANAAARIQRRGTGSPGVSALRVAHAPDGARPHAIEADMVPAAAVADEADAGGNYRRLAERLDQRNTWLSSALDHRTRSGSAGTSQYGLSELPIEWKRPLTRDGRWTWRADIVTVRAGGLDLATSAETFGSALLCQPECNTGVLNQTASGMALNASLERGNTRYDIGTTPLGFPVQTLVGGVLHKGDLGPFGYSVDLSRRPLTGSLLSYAGTRDPRTGQVWGGVQANGVRFGLSLDEGGTLGGWSSLGLHRLTGRNVKDNNRMQLMAGGMLRVINEDDRLLQFGVTGMHWRMSENAGEYTFGHGGYYSPARYTSLSLPVTYGERYTRFSYAIRASVSASRSDAKAAPFFPTDPAMQLEAENRSAFNGVAPFYGGGPGRGIGRSLSLAWEYQADPRLFVGGRLELDRSPDYSPNRFLVYLRYAVDRQAARPVSFLPEALYPTSQY